jgi:hypothetical protein
MLPVYRNATGSIWLDCVQRVRDRVNAYGDGGLDAPGILTSYRRPWFDFV